MGRRLGLLKRWALALRSEVIAVFFAARDPAAPLLPRLLALFIAAYALSPIDLIPDFIPVLGLLDELILLPLGLWLVLRWMPAAVMQRARARAAALLEKPRSWLAAAAIVLLWLLLLAALLAWLGLWPWR
ncbi:DUF1232 domain-containing protein [Roseateles violae]|uniref:DUF1232 domain-containing protein n=1 Tax=Roseateles violae TaxID=3058042 RepID=A0ABT8DPK4_9BURK|nr:DUF1232 domain-containing protein [Pelomonas sp. PFR6]MDN3919003.1 DUF1232 domain-containing protein [Pelomonas sp. PFR6]